MGMHDLSYRRLFSQPRMVEELLRGFAAEPWVEPLDFSRLRRANASFVSAHLQGREGDLAWRLEMRDGTPVYLLLELQSRDEPFMAVRLMAYEALLYQSLIAEKRLSGARKLPRVVLIVLYNGKRRWRAALELGDLVEGGDPAAEAFRPRLRYLVIDVARYPEEELAKRRGPVAELFRIERSQDWKVVQASVARLDRSLRSPRDRELRQAFETWLNKVVSQRLAGHPGYEPAALSLEELKDMLAERVEALYRLERMRGRRDGRAEGRREGEAEMLLRQLQLKFGPLDEDVRTRVHAAEPDLLLEWAERILTARRLQDVFAGG